MASEQIAKRMINQRAILSALHLEGPLRRSVLSESLGIRKSSVSNIVSDLLADGILREEQPGRLRSAIGLDRDRFHVVAAALTAHDLHIGRVYLDGTMRDRTTVPIVLSEGPEAIVGQLAEGMKQLLQTTKGHVLGIGAATPGIVDPVKGRCIQAVNIPGWKDVDLGSILADRLNSPVTVDNDVRCQLRACTWFDRLGRDAENVIYLHVHDGVACSIMSRGSLVIGERFTAGEIGHVSAGNDGRLCTCGKADCLEAYCSLPAILREILTVCPESRVKNAADIVERARELPAIERVLDRIALRLGQALAGLVAAMDPHTLVIGTSDRRFSELLKPPLKRHLYNELIALHARDAEIRTIDDVVTMSLKGVAAAVIDSAFGQEIVPA
ncbi:MAG: ROK family transcriptional regulator [Kiritimatiellia bacterium]|jgi:predicted NBD/HSP70 family sugar kinase|nr:ROK family transcriptional regulator [Kiritimatiellia bacterium]MDP6847627.1 ROK family transcriptional regulator [Kiritimatiellia bacterium]